MIVNNSVPSGAHEPAKVAKERVTYAYMQVPSKYKSLNRELPNMEVGFSIKCHNVYTQMHALAR